MNLVRDYSHDHSQLYFLHHHNRRKSKPKFINRNRSLLIFASPPLRLPIQLLTFLLLLLLAIQSPICLAFRIGDPVTLLIRSQSKTIDGLRNQMPRFGTFSSTTIDHQYLTTAAFAATYSSSYAKKRLPISMTFGSRSLPSWIDLYDGRGKRLEKIVITFVYSSSGEGEIHSVTTTEMKYVDIEIPNTESGTGDGGGDISGGSTHVDYLWIEEADVDTLGGMYVMALFTLIASLAVFIGTCCDDDDDGDDETSIRRASTEYDYRHQDLSSEGSYMAGNSHYQHYGRGAAISQTSSVPKWD